MTLNHETDCLIHHSLTLAFSNGAKHVTQTSGQDILGYALSQHCKCS